MLIKLTKVQNFFSAKWRRKSATNESVWRSDVKEEALAYAAPETLGAVLGTVSSSASSLGNALFDYSLEPISATALTRPMTALTGLESSADADCCAICFAPFCDQTGSESCRIRACGHEFHTDCIQQWLLNHDPTCPSCRKPVHGVPQGRAPSGTMKVQRSDEPCPGYCEDGNHDAGCGTIEIVYDIPSGVQLGYHENPGLPYRGTLRVAYLPDTIQGRQLLARLKYAWKHGLIFQVGTSLTTGETNVVTWSSIHHKTSLKSGPFGYPDPNFLYNCNESLNALYVPDADTCALQEEQGDP